MYKSKFFGPSQNCFALAYVRVSVTFRYSAWKCQESTKYLGVSSGRDQDNTGKVHMNSWESTIIALRKYRRNYWQSNQKVSVRWCQKKNYPLADEHHLTWWTNHQRSFPSCHSKKNSWEKLVLHGLGKPALTLGILVSLLGFWAS